jgi:DNA-binding CsgD family transcriptional regulator
MSILDRLLFLIGLRPQPGSRTYEISESLQTTLTTLAQHESRPVDELIPDLLAAGLTQYRTTDELWKLWESLTARERDVVALACLEYSNREIGLRLGISHETVKTRLQSALKKFNVHSRHELRLMLVVNARWDFSAWERQS